MAMLSSQLLWVLWNMKPPRSITQKATWLATMVTGTSVERRPSAA